jgi:6-phosphogluconolactonase
MVSPSPFPTESNFNPKGREFMDCASNTDKQVRQWCDGIWPYRAALTNCLATIAVDGAMARSRDSTGGDKPRPSLTRRQVMPLLGATALASLARPAFAGQLSGRFGSQAAALARFVYVGTYTFPGTAPGGTHQIEAHGIYLFKMSPSDGGLTPLQPQPFIILPNPSYLAVDPGLRHLYSVNEMTDGGVSAYLINQTSGTLTFLNAMPTNGKDTTHLSVQASGQYLFAASYTSGDFQVFRIRGDGFIGVMTDNFASVGNGTGPDPDRQEGPHAHQILTDRDGNHVFGVDLGADKVNVWNLDAGVLSQSVLEFVWRGLRLDKDIRSGSEVNRLVSELLG